MSMAVGSKLQLEPGSWMEALFDVYIGILVGTSHSVKIISRWWFTNTVLPLLKAGGFNIVTDGTVKSKDGLKTLKVVAVGYGRTGTYSLTLALEELGLPTLHTQHMYENEEIFDMWTDQVFLPAIKAGKVELGKPDLRLVAEKGYQATADLPMAFYFEQVMEEFPDCKFILTTRENSEEWFQSWDTLTKSIVQPTHLGRCFFTNVKQYAIYLRWLFSVVNDDVSYMTAPFPLPDQKRESSIMGYEEHNRRVRSLIPKEKLLEYNVKQGWEPLCSFLEINDCPQTPFPKTNSARSVQVQAISSFIIPLTCILFVLFYAFAHGFRRLTGKTVLQWANWKSRQVMMLLRRVFLGEKVELWGTLRHRKKL